MWILAIGLVVVVCVMASKAPATSAMETLPPNDTVSPMGNTIPSPATSGSPMAGEFYANAMDANYKYPGVKRTVNRKAAVMRAEESVADMTPGSSLVDGGKALMTQAIPPRPPTIAPAPGAGGAKRIKL